jgi:cytoskeleton protein RodZ
MDIGGELRRARQARSRSIESISAATKISPTVLRAIENNAFDRVPGGLFTRGFLRAYAREVGLNGEAIVQQYRAEFELPAGDAPPDSAAAGDTDLPLDQANEVSRSKRTQVIEVAVIVLAVVVYFGWLRQPDTSANAERRSTDAVTAASVAMPVAATPADVPVATTGTKTGPTTGMMGEAGGDLKVEIRPQGPCWVEATSDNQRIVARLMNAGERQAVSVRQDLTLLVGDPAAFAFSINGVPGRSLGRGGVVTRVQINPRNYQTFVEPGR